MSKFFVVNRLPKAKNNMLYSQTKVKYEFPCLEAASTYCTSQDLASRAFSTCTTHFLESCASFPTFHDFTLFLHSQTASHNARNAPRTYNTAY